MTEKEYSLSIQVNRNIPRQNRLQSLITAMQTRNENFDNGKICFKDPDGIRGSGSNHISALVAPGPNGVSRSEAAKFNIDYCDFHY